MSKLAKAAAAKGFDFPVKKDSKKKSSLDEIQTPPAIAAIVDSYLINKAKQDEIEANVKEAAAKLRDFSLGLALDRKSMQSQILTGKEGAVNLVFKDEYALNAEKKEQLDNFLKGKGQDPEAFVTEKTTVAFNFDIMSEKERDAMFDFIKKSLGAERFGQIVSEIVKYEVKGLKDKMPMLAKDKDEFAHLRSISGQYAPTVAVRKEKARL